MDAETMTLLMKGLTIAIGGIVPALSIGSIGRTAMEGIARNPEAKKEMNTPMLLSMAFTEAIAIYALIIAFSL